MGDLAEGGTNCTAGWAGATGVVFRGVGGRIPSSSPTRLAPPPSVPDTDSPNNLLARWLSLSFLQSEILSKLAWEEI